MSAALKLADVVPLRWTARGFARAGVVFTTRGATMTVSGPPARDDLRDALLAEVLRRADVFATFAPERRDWPFPRVQMPGVTPVRHGACESCGDALNRGGMCELCMLALQRVLKQLGRL